MTPDEIAALFTRTDGTFLFARWGRPLAPVIFGLADETLPVMKGAIEAVAALAGREVAEIDPELGANLMVFFCADWDEIADVPNLDRLIPDLAPLLDRLRGAEANQYRVFRFDNAGAIRAAFVFVRMDVHLEAAGAEAVALSQAVQTILLWSDAGFTDASPLGRVGGAVVLKPEIAGLIRAAYDPALPDMGQDAALAYRIAARQEALQ